MATLVVRKLDELTVQRLKERAKAAGRSAEAEHRAILEQSLVPKRSGAEFLRELRDSGPLLEDDDPFFKALEAMHEPAEPFEFPD